MRITVLGLGLIGAIWRELWHTDGHAVRAWNRSPKPEVPGWAASPVEAVTGAEIIAVVVSDGPAVLSLLRTLAPALRPGQIVTQHVTIGVDETHAAAALVQATGAGFLDMPFTGSKTAAGNRQVVWYVGDDAALLPQVEPAYRPLARALLPMGGIGQAMTMKLVMNLNIAGVFQALAEALGLARTAGLSEADFFRALELNVGRSGVADLKKPKLLEGDFSPHFAVKHLRKDLGLVLRLAASLGLDLPGTATTQAAYRLAGEQGLDELDFSSLSSQVRARS